MGCGKRLFSFRFRNAHHESTCLEKECSCLRFVMLQNFVCWCMTVYTYTTRIRPSLAKYGKASALLLVFRDVCCTCKMSENVLAVGLEMYELEVSSHRTTSAFRIYPDTCKRKKKKDDLGCASVVPSELTSSSYTILDKNLEETMKEEDTVKTVKMWWFSVRVLNRRFTFAITLYIEYKPRQVCQWDKWICLNFL